MLRLKQITNFLFEIKNVHLNGRARSLRNLCVGPIVGFTLTVVNEFRRFLSQFSTNFHEILHILFSIHVVTTLTISRSFDKYLRSKTI